MTNSHAWFGNFECRFYPCHSELMEQNCLFCFCPLYWFDDCGGTFIRTEKGVKDCSGCIRPHRIDGYEEILAEIRKRMPRGSAEETAG